MYRNATFMDLGGEGGTVAWLEEITTKCNRSILKKSLYTCDAHEHVHVHVHTIITISCTEQRRYDDARILHDNRLDIEIKTII